MKKRNQKRKNKARKKRKGIEVHQIALRALVKGLTRRKRGLKKKETNNLKYNNKL